MANLFQNCNFKVVWILIVETALRFFPRKKKNSTLNYTFYERQQAKIISVATHVTKTDHILSFIKRCPICFEFKPEFLASFQNYTLRLCCVKSTFRSITRARKSIWYMDLPVKTIFYG